MKLIKNIIMTSLIPLTMSLASCNSTNYKIITKFIEASSIEFGDLNLGITNTQFKERGYAYGDLVSVTVKDYNDDGKDYVFPPMPYVTNYNEAGYFAPCLCNYEDNKRYVEFAPGMHESSLRCTDFLNKTVILNMYSKGGYKRKLDLINCKNKLSYEELGKDNEAFGNCRDVVKVGNIRNYIKPHLLYRGSSPFNPKANPADRHIKVDNFLEDNQIINEVSLANSLKSIQGYMDNAEVKENCPYTIRLFANRYDPSPDVPVKSDNQFFYVALGGNYFYLDGKGTGGGDKMKSIFEMMADKCLVTSGTPQSFFIHCNEGKDRTGFVLMVLEALCGVPLEDIVADFMLTFKNYYNISKVNDLERYNAIADIIPYRHVYSILIDNPNTELGKIDWINFDSKAEVTKIIKKDTTLLQKRARNYLENVLKISTERVNALYNNFRLK